MIIEIIFLSSSIHQSLNYRTRETFIMYFMLWRSIIKIQNPHSQSSLQPIRRFYSRLCIFCKPVITNHIRLHAYLTLPYAPRKLRSNGRVRIASSHQSSSWWKSDAVNQGLVLLEIHYLYLTLPYLTLPCLYSVASGIPIPFDCAYKYSPGRLGCFDSSYFLEQFFSAPIECARRLRKAKVI